MTDLATMVKAVRLGLRAAAVTSLAALALPTAASGREPAGSQATGLPIIVARQAKPARERLDANVADILRIFLQAGVDLPDLDREALAATARLPDDLALGAIQKVLDRYALALVDVNDEAWFNITAASSDPADRAIVQRQWRTFLVKVNNNSRATSPFEVRSLQAIGGTTADVVAPQAETGGCEETPHGWAQWFRLRLVGAPAFPARLSGKEIEYFIVQMCSLDIGERAAEFTFYLGGGQVSQGHYGAIGLLFRPTAAPAAGR